jgi:hypothetical protein
MATIRTVDRKKFKVEISGGKLDEEISHVAARGVPILRVKREGKEEFVWINANHIVSFEDAAES